MTRRAGGRPVMAVLAVLAGWVVVRASIWEPPFPLPSPDAIFAKANTGSARPARGEAATGAMAVSSPVLAQWPVRGGALPLTRIAGVATQDRLRLPSAPGLTFAHPAISGQLARSRSAASHQMLYAAAFATLPAIDRSRGGGLSEARNTAPGRGQRGLPWAWGPLPATSLTRASEPAERAPRPGRWSGDAWLLLRDGARPRRVASANPASYGSDQLGAVVRYSLAPDSALQPAVYVRASKALVGDGESEVASGASVSLSRSFPLRVHGEVRLTDRPGVPGDRTEVRPAAFVVTGLPRQRIAGVLDADSYLQAGYVGGDFETAFVDGKATLEAPLLRSGKARVAVGGGVWGGAQRGASRVDAGPTATLVLSSGRANLRASLDYRFRVAGDARPGDGPALTLSASF